ncbi:SLBB domain-containing protein [Fructilactobacillus florum]|uniref:SLBB domain-containing protein n=1 Tax=Fructilactobacillus florum TaxID=640331 RepID=UPI0006D1AE38|nr:SLBB domain-containing protein [Fructilactobacillus florum]
MDKYREKLVELVQDHGAKLWIVIIGIMVVISGYFLWPQSVASSENQQQVTQPVSPKSQPIHQKGMLKKTFVVEVKGAVQRPGVYHLPPGTRCETLIQQAGGFTPTADQRQVNLAKKSFLIKKACMFQLKEKISQLLCRLGVDQNNRRNRST